ncbi:hypothetical protein SDC9_120591 [bioreactor metagenome]|uniref:Uncharacterized protein n=1 Tax=bioreactor metagenome TaxID=1076179 RepID=A0A645C7I8_9ZZZZ
MIPTGVFAQQHGVADEGPAGGVGHLTHRRTGVAARHFRQSLVVGLVRIGQRRQNAHREQPDAVVLILQRRLETVAALRRIVGQQPVPGVTPDFRIGIFTIVGDARGIAAAQFAELPSSGDDPGGILFCAEGSGQRRQQQDNSQFPVIHRSFLHAF